MTALEVCPECRIGRLVERENAKRGTRFMGCTRFPVCRHTEAHPDDRDDRDDCDAEFWTDCDLY
jgi:ssDNA-binding Zn-finger/Zn-ribbon topoisomerase 1